MLSSSLGSTLEQVRADLGFWDQLNKLGRVAGVILATAFIHLLDDAFRSLQSPQVKSRYQNIGKYTGLIMCASLLPANSVSNPMLDYVPC